MRLKSFITSILLFAISLFCSGQEPLAPLTIGDHVPDLTLENIINYPEGKARLSDFEDKLLILDFWATWCLPCVRAIPGFEQLQAEFGDQIKILMVTSQPANTVGKCFSNKGVTLPSVTGDQKLSELFPHKYVPHEVWIKDGKVLAITGEAEVTAANIQKLLAEKSAVLSEKKSNFDYDLTKPLLLDGNGGQSSDLLYHSVFTAYLDGIGGGGVYTDSLNRFKIRALNGTVLQLYQSAMRNTNKRKLAQTNRCILDFDKQEVLPPPDAPPYSPAARNKYYCYELIVPDTLKREAGWLMMEELNRFFAVRYHIRGSIEKRMVRCWALRKTNTVKELTAQNVGQEVPINISGENISQPFSKFYKSITGLYQHEPYPIIDQTGITSEITISFPVREKDIRRFSTHLEKEGLCLVLDSCEIDMLVIKQFK